MDMENEYIEYKGHQILKKAYVPVQELYCKLGSNYFELEDYDLEQMLEDLNKKAEELKLKGIDFKNLKYYFCANEDHSDDDYSPYDAECEVFIQYQVLEDDEQSKERIQEQKAWIDKKIEDQRHQEEAQELVDRYAVEQAMKLLNEKGYSVTKN